MDIANIISQLRFGGQSGFDSYERSPGVYQLVAPIFYEDGDMVDIYLQKSPRGENYIRICDYGMAMMRLSYTFEINSKARRRIFKSILINNGVMVENGNLYLDAQLNMIYESIFQFAGCSQKVCNMRYWSKAIASKTSLYEDLREYITSEMKEYNPVADKEPISGYNIISVDWSMTHNSRNFYLFGVHNKDKAKSTVIFLLELKKEKLPFMSLIVHEGVEDLGKKEKTYLVRNADEQYLTFSDFRERGSLDIRRLARAA